MPSEGCLPAARSSDQRAFAVNWEGRTRYELCQGMDCVQPCTFSVVFNLNKLLYLLAIQSGKILSILVKQY